MQREESELVVAWHGSKWRDDRVDVEPPPVVTTPQGLSPAKRPHERRGGRKAVIAPAVAQTIRTAEKPLSAIEVHKRVAQKMKCTVAGVHSAMYRLQRDRRIELADRRAGFGQFGATYQWKENPNEALDAVKLTARKAEIGRLGGLKSAEALRKAESC